MKPGKVFTFRSKKRPKSISISYSRGNFFTKSPPQATFITNFQAHKKLNLGPEKEAKNQEKIFFENKKKKMAENVDNSRISPRKKNILGKTFETLISVEQYEKNIMPEQLNILKRGENLLQKLLEYEKELYDEELSELGKKGRKRQDEEEEDINIDSENNQEDGFFETALEFLDQLNAVKRFVTERNKYVFSI